MPQGGPGNGYSNGGVVCSGNPARPLSRAFRRPVRQLNSRLFDPCLKVLCSQPWPADTIGRDFELPVQITASPVQNSPGIRSLEEELQEAILKAQVGPRQAEKSISQVLDFIARVFSGQ